MLNLEVITAILGFAAAFIAKETWDYIKEKKKKEDDGIGSMIEKNTAAINQLSMSILELKIRIDYLSEKLAPLPKMQNDIQHAHNKIRNITEKMDLVNGE